MQSADNKGSPAESAPAEVKREADVGPKAENTAKPPKDGQPEKRPTRLGWNDLKILVVFLCFVLAVEGIALSLWSWSVSGASDSGGKTLSGWAVFATGMICSGAASLLGGLLGFLFGIPRSVESSAGRLRLSGTTVTAPSEAVVAGAVPAAVRSTTGRPRLLRVNTNLEDISDGVTKVLLGAGLAEASKLVEGASNLAAFLGPSFGPGSAGQAVAIATIAYGALEGFFAGYLATRLYLTAAFERNDPHGDS
jgi:hypothetical protein